MLEGKRGYPYQKAMEILVRVGEIYGASRLIPVASVHMPGSSVVVAGEAGTRFVERMAREGGKFAAFTTLNPAAGDLDNWQALGFLEEDIALQSHLTNAYKVMGGVPCHTCTPYLLGNIPRLGEHVAWGESSAIAFVNSVLGARTNREGGPTALAAALAGRVPLYGYHLAENRRGQILVRVQTRLAGVLDYGCLGYYVGTIAQDRVPVFTGIEPSCTLEELKTLAAALASSGAVALFHVVGVTPEAATVEQAFGGREVEDVLDFGAREAAQTRARLNKSGVREAGLVVIGCPHCSLKEVAEVASFMAGKKVSGNAGLWVLTSVAVKRLAERCGYAEIIEAAGGHIVCDTCTVLGAMKGVIERQGLTVISTNSAKLAHYVPGQYGLEVHYGSTAQCLAAAVKGVWD